MNPQTLTDQTSEESAVKNRLLSTTGGGLTTSDPTTRDLIGSFDPQSIMSKYKGLRTLAEETAGRNKEIINSQAGTAIEDTNIADTKSLTGTLEGQRGFAQMPVALNYMQASHDKRIKDLDKQRKELLMSNENEKARSFSDIMIKEENAMSTARTNVLNNYFNFNQEQRAVASFETPQKKADRELKSATTQSVLTLSQNAPDAGITSADTYDSAITKYKNSETYKRNVRKGEADIAAVQANISQSNASAAKSLFEAGGATPGGTLYSGEFAATIKLAAQHGGTNVQRAQVTKNLQDFIAQGDYPSAYTQILTSTAAGLQGTTKQTFQEQNNSLGVLNTMQKAIEAYAAAGGNTNIFKGTADKIQNKIGALLTDPKYASLAVQLNAAFQVYRLQMTGAAFGPKESAEYASILPAPGNTMELNLTKIKGAQNYLNSSVDSSIKSVVGQGGVYIKEKAQTPSTGVTSTGSPTDTVRSLTQGSTYKGYKLPF